MNNTSTGSGLSLFLLDKLANFAETVLANSWGWAAGSLSFAGQRQYSALQIRRKLTGKNLGQSFQVYLLHSWRFGANEVALPCLMGARPSKPEPEVTTLRGWFRCKGDKPEREVPAFANGSSIFVAGFSACLQGARTLSRREVLCRLWKRVCSEVPMPTAASALQAGGQFARSFKSGLCRPATRCSSCADDSPLWEIGSELGTEQRLAPKPYFLAPRNTATTKSKMSNMAGVSLDAL